MPVISIPAWAYANGRATARLGKTAETFYANESGTVPAPVQSPPLLGPPTARKRRNFVVLLVVTWLVLGALAAIIPLGRYAHFLPLAGRLLAEVGLLVAVSKIFLATRPFGHLATEPTTPPAPGTT